MDFYNGFCYNQVSKMRTGSLRQMVAGGLTQLGWEMLPSINALAEFGT